MGVRRAGTGASSPHTWQITRQADTDLRPGTGNTAEPSGELSEGDVVAVGEAGLAVASVGWTAVRGGLNEVRTSEHGTRPGQHAGAARTTHTAQPFPGQIKERPDDDT